MSTTSTPGTRGTKTADCKGGARLSRAAAVIEAKRAENGREHFGAYRCSSCLQPNGTAAWHVRRLSRWRQMLTGQG